MIYTILVYNTILILSLCFAYLAERGKDKIQRACCRVFVFLILWIPAILRYGIGTDYLSYEEIYLGNIYDSLEIGFVFIVNILRNLDYPSFVYFALIATLTYLPIVFGVKRQGYFFVIFLFFVTFYFQTYTMLRQALSVCIIVYAMICYNEGKLIKYFIFIFIASLFHASALLMFFLSLLAKLKVSSKYLFIALFVLMFLIFKLDLTNSILNSPLLLESQYASYSGGGFADETELGSGLGIIMNLILPFMVIIFRKKILELNDRYNFLVNLSAFYIFAYFLAANIHIFNRILDLVRFVPILSAPILFSVIKGRYGIIFVSIILLVYLVIFEKAIFVNNINNAGGLGISPYTTIFNK